MSSGDASQAMAVVASGLCGLLIGSFLNVVIYRVPRQLSIVRPPSHCPACDARLTALDMVPVVSWLVLRGHCRHCGGAVAGRYPIVEALAGAGFAGLALALGSVAPLPSLSVVTCCALAAAVIDADGSPVPGALVVVASLSAISLVAVAVAVGHADRVVWALLGAALAAGAAAVADRSGDAGRWRNALVMAVLAWCAGWLWPAGGPLVAAWVLVAAAATRTAANQRAPLALLVAGAFAVVIVAAVLLRP